MPIYRVSEGVEASPASTRSMAELKGKVNIASEAEYLIAEASEAISVFL